MGKTIIFCIIKLCISTIFIITFVYCMSQEDIDSEFSPFCDDEVFYRPYIRITEGRLGPMIKNSGPGFIDLTNMEDLYVCANGLVFLYFKIVREYGEVYDDAVMQYAAHYCGFFNGRMGPGVEDRNVTLYAILLVGNSKDYRKMAVQMFNAPWYNKTTHTTTNFSSLAIINSGGECILQKGTERANIRIKANPPNASEGGSSPTSSNSSESEEDEKEITLCRLDVNILLNNPPDKVPIDTDLTTAEEALLALELSESGELSLYGCYEYPILDGKQLEIVERRLEESRDSSSRIDQNNSELNPTDGSSLSFWTTERLEKYGSPITDLDNSTLESDVETKNTSYHEQLSKPKAEQDKEKLKEEKEALQLALFKLQLAPHLQKYKELHDTAKNYGEKCEANWTEVFEAMRNEDLLKTRKNYTETAKQLSEIPYNKRFEPYNQELDKKYNDILQERKGYYETLQERTLELGPTITKAEVMAARLKAILKLTRNKMEQIKKLIIEFERHKMVPKRGMDHVDVPTIVQDMFISIKNAGGASDSDNGTDNTACFNFPKKSDQCKAAKPSQERACQIGMSSIGGGGTSDWPGGEADKWRDEVLDLLTSIFSKACPYLEGGFAKSVNRIVRGYLMNKPEGIGIENGTITGAPIVDPILQNFISNYQIRSDNVTLQPKDSAVWDGVIESLRKCKESVEPLKFEFAGMHPLTLSSGGKAIPLNKEKADMEFAFNFAIDANFKIFATVQGICLKDLGTAAAKQFYEAYSTDFLDPIRQIWLSNRDNAIFNVILGRYLASGKGELWTKYCMESSFIQADEGIMRPLRKLLVNTYTEPNFFVDGPLADSRGEYPINF